MLISLTDATTCPLRHNFSPTLMVKLNSEMLSDIALHFSYNGAESSNGWE